MNQDHIHDHASHEKPNKFIVLLICAIIAVIFIFAPSQQNSGQKDVFKGRVTKILSEEDVISEMDGRTIKEQNILVTVQIENEKKEVQVVNDLIPVKPEDNIFVRKSLLSAGEEQNAEQEEQFDIIDISRSRGIFIIAAIFALLVFLTSGLKGFYSLVGLALSFTVIFYYVVPQILNGANPILTGIFGSVLILIPTLYLVHGLGKKTIAALAGILLALIFVGVFANIAVGLLGFSGFTGEESVFLSIEAGNKINLVGLLMAGIIIAAVGVLDDVAITQASTVFNIASVNPALGGLGLFKKSMEIGKDHISAVVNTLVLAYTGAALPLVLLFSLRGVPFSYFVSIEIVAEEIVRTLISSTGLLLAVPMTTMIAVFLARRTKDNMAAKT